MVKFKIRSRLILRRPSIFIPIPLDTQDVWSLNQDLQQVIELKIEDTTCQRFDEEVKEKKVEFIVDNDINQEMEIIENIV